MSAMNLLQSIFGANLGGQQGMYQGGMGMGGRPMAPQVFRRKYHAYSPAYWNSENRDKLESGDKIVMPASALEELSRMHVEFPIMFEIAHDSDILPKKSHCSVMEFTAPEGSVYLPIWMIDNLGLDPQGDSVIELTTVSLPKGQFVQFQAHETKFAMLANPRVVLEKALRNYSCLTVGDTIQIEFNNYIYKLDVTEVKPSVQRGTAPPAISIIETDINVDFKEPRDYKEWEKQQKAKKLDLPPGGFDHVNGSFHTDSPTNNNNSNNNNSSNNTNSNYDSKMDDLNNDGLFDDNDDGFMIQDWRSQKKKEKQGYFEQLQASGSQGQKVKDRNKKKRNSGSTTGGNTGGISGISGGGTMSSAMNSGTGGMKLGKSSRGAPLGGGSNGGNGSASIVSGTGMIKSNVQTKKIEEVIGNMRYIYEVDEMGNRKLIRRLPMRKLPMDSSKGYSLQ